MLSPNILPQDGVIVSDGSSSCFVWKVNENIYSFTPSQIKLEVSIADAIGTQFLGQESSFTLFGASKVKGNIVFCLGKTYQNTQTQTFSCCTNIVIFTPQSEERKTFNFESPEDFFLNDFRVCFCSQHVVCWWSYDYKFTIIDLNDGSLREIDVSDCGEIIDCSGDDKDNACILIRDPFDFVRSFYVFNVFSSVHRMTVVASHCEDRQMINFRGVPVRNPELLHWNKVSIQSNEVHVLGKKINGDRTQWLETFTLVNGNGLLPKLKTQVAAVDQFEHVKSFQSVGKNKFLVCGTLTPSDNSKHFIWLSTDETMQHLLADWIGKSIPNILQLGLPTCINNRLFASLMVNNHGLLMSQFASMIYFSRLTM